MALPYFIRPAKNNDELEKRKLLAGEVKSLATERDERTKDPEYATPESERSTASGIRPQAEILGVPQNALSNMFQQSLASYKAPKKTTKETPANGSETGYQPVGGFGNRMGPSTPIGPERVSNKTILKNILADAQKNRDREQEKIDAEVESVQVDPFNEKGLETERKRRKKYDEDREKYFDSIGKSPKPTP